MHQFNADELIITGYPEPKQGGMQTGAIPKGVKVVHKATGLVVTCDTHRHSYKNREDALLALAEQLSNLEKSHGF